MSHFRCKVWIEYIIHILTELWKSLTEILGANNPDRSSQPWWNSWLGWFKRNKDSSHSNHDGDGSGFRNGRGKHAEFVELPSTSKTFLCYCSCGLDTKCDVI